MVPDPGQPEIGHDGVVRLVLEIYSEEHLRGFKEADRLSAAERRAAALAGVYKI